MTAFKERAAAWALAGRRATVRAGAAIGRGARWTAGAAARAWRSDLRRRILRPILVSGRVVLAAALLAAVVVGTGAACVRRVAPTDHVVRQHSWGGGVEPRDLAPGFHLGSPGRTVWHVIDARTVYLRMGPVSEGNPLPPLELRTADDLELSLSVTVPFRIRPGAAHRVVEDGLKSTFKQNAKTAIEKVLLERFAQLRSEEWFSTERRNAVSAEALIAVNEALERIHVVAEAVLVTGAVFPSLYEQKLAEQKINGQKLVTAPVLARRDLQKHEIEVEQAAVDRAEAERAAVFDLANERAKIELEADVLAVKTAADGYRDARTVEANNRYVKAVAEGQLAVDRAEALRVQLTNETLETAGGRLMLAQDAAAAIRFKSVKLDANSPGVPSLLDLDSFIKLLIGEAGG